MILGEKESSDRAAFDSGVEIKKDDLQPKKYTEKKLRLDLIVLVLRWPAAEDYGRSGWVQRVKESHPSIVRVLVYPENERRDDCKLGRSNLPGPSLESCS